MSRIRVLASGEPDNFVVVDEDGDIIEGVIKVVLVIERGKRPFATLEVDGLDVDTRAEIKHMIGEVKGD